MIQFELNAIVMGMGYVEKLFRERQLNPSNYREAFSAKDNSAKMPTIDRLLHCKPLDRKLYC